jgi:2-haloacid dehalogenase
MLWVFDINETLLDMAALDPVFGSAERRREWFDLLIHSALVTTATGGYRDFAALGAACARTVGDRHGGPPSDATLAELGATMRALPPHPEVHDALTSLRSRGERLLAFGNSPPAVIDGQLRSAGLSDLFDARYSAAEFGVLKPARDAYRSVLREEALAADEAVMVAAHDWDIAGAQNAGMRTVLVSRDGRRPLPGWPAPDAITARLPDASHTELTT